MAIPINIKTLLSGNVAEWAGIEFKETWDPAASLKSVCAFANDLDNWGGGYIVIGVEEENGRPGGETRPYSSPKTVAKDNKERIHYIRNTAKIRSSLVRYKKRDGNMQYIGGYETKMMNSKTRTSNRTVYLNSKAVSYLQEMKRRNDELCFNSEYVVCNKVNAS